jgi:hypothetical protein
MNPCHTPPPADTATQAPTSRQASSYTVRIELGPGFTWEHFFSEVFNPQDYATEDKQNADLP